MLSSSRGGEYSYEDPAYENGLFTEALLEAFSGRRADADRCFGTWNQAEAYTRPSAVYSVRWVDYGHYDPTDGWFDTCRDEGWTREMIVVEHASGDPEVSGPEDRVVFHQRRRCASATAVGRTRSRT